MCATHLARPPHGYVVRAIRRDAVRAPGKVDHVIHPLDHGHAQQVGVVKVLPEQATPGGVLNPQVVVPTLDGDDPTIPPAWVLKPNHARLHHWARGPRAANPQALGHNTEGTVLHPNPPYSIEIL